MSESFELNREDHSRYISIPDKGGYRKVVNGAGRLYYCYENNYSPDGEIVQGEPRSFRLGVYLWTPDYARVTVLGPEDER